MAVTSDYRKVILADDPLYYMPMDPETIDDSTTFVVENIAADFVDAPTMDGYRQFNNASGVVYPDISVSGDSGVEFDKTVSGSGDSGLSISCNEIIAPSDSGSGRSSIGADVMINADVFTFEYWIKAPNDGGGDYLYMGIQGDASALEDYATAWPLELYIGDTDLSGTFQFTDNAASVGAGITDPFDNVWHHHAWVWDGADTFIYQDGVQVGTQFMGPKTVEWPVSTSTAADLTGFVFALGGVFAQADASDFTGFLDDFAYYAYSLTPAQVLAHYNAGTGSGRVLYTDTDVNPVKASFPHWADIDDTSDTPPADRAVVLQSDTFVWRDSSDVLLSDTDFTRMAVTCRVPEETTLSYRKSEWLCSMLNTSGDSAMEFGLGYDKRSTDTTGKIAKWTVFNGTDPEVSAPRAVIAGGFDSYGVTGGYFAFDWQQGEEYRFEIKQSGSYTALYINDSLVKKYNHAWTGVDVSSLSFICRDWQHYSDPLMEVDWFYSRGYTASEEFSLREVSTDMDHNGRVFESQTKHAVAINGYVFRQRMHVPYTEVVTSGGVETVTIEELPNIPATMSNTGSVDWIPVVSDKE